MLRCIILQSFRVAVNSILKNFGERTHDHMKWKQYPEINVASHTKLHCYFATEFYQKATKRRHICTKRHVSAPAEAPKY